MVKLFSILLVLGLFFSGCGSSKKTTVANVPLTDSQWRLTELMGRPLPTGTATMTDVTLAFTKEGNRVSGFSGCNTFGGSYATPDPAKISFSQMLSTMKACPSNMDLESAFLKMLQEVDSYAINGNVLSLNKSKLGTVAKFEVIKK
jgi:heat shock protein HslJ